MKKLRKKEPYTMLDANFYTTLPFRKLRKKYGSDGVMLYLMIVSKLRITEGNIITIDDLEAVGEDEFGFQTEFIKSVVDYTASIGLLDIDNNTITNAQVSILTEHLKSRADTYANNAKKRWDSMQLQCNSNAIAEPLSTSTSTSTSTSIDLRSKDLRSIDPVIPIYDNSVMDCAFGKTASKVPGCDNVMLTESEVEMLKLEFLRHDLGDEDIRRSVLAVSKYLLDEKNKHMRSRAYHCLVTWGLQQAIRDKTERQKMENTKLKDKQKEQERPKYKLYKKEN